MKILGLREAKQTLSDCVDHSQLDRVLITRHGRPAAIIIGVEGEEMEDVLLQMDPKFWKLIEQRRQDPETISLEDVQKRYQLDRPVAKRGPIKARKRLRKT